MFEGAAPQGADALDLRLARQFLPLEDCVLTAETSAEIRAWLKAHLGEHRLHAVSRDTLLRHIRERHGAALRDQAIFGLARRFPELSAQTVITPAQLWVFGALAIGAVGAFAFHPLAAARICIALLSLAFAASGVFRVILALLARRPRTAATAVPAALPSYTILVPLYREVAVLPDLVAGLAALDYPAHLLDIKLVLEEDDAETIAAARALRTDAVAFEIVAVPPGGPRTKPKACGEFLGAFAECFGFSWFSELAAARNLPPFPAGGVVFGR
jgi:hypothetical protein